MTTLTTAHKKSSAHHQGIALYPHQGSTQDDTASSTSLYERALGHARAQQFEDASRQFEQLLEENPEHSKAWISYAQMSKKSAGRIGHEAGHDACRSVLRRAMEHNPDSGQLYQAAGLLELQDGRPDEALVLLQRAVKLQPSLAPVLRWKAVREAAGDGTALAGMLPGRHADESDCT